MAPPPSRVIVVTAWAHEGNVASVLLVSGRRSAEPDRRITAGSVEAACAELEAVLRELTVDPTDSDTCG